MVNQHVSKTREMLPISRFHSICSPSSWVSMNNLKRKRAITSQYKKACKRSNKVLYFVCKSVIRIYNTSLRFLMNKISLWMNNKLRVLHQPLKFWSGKLLIKPLDYVLSNISFYIKNLHIITTDVPPHSLSGLEVEEIRASFWRNSLDEWYTLRFPLRWYEALSIDTRGGRGSLDHPSHSTTNGVKCSN